MTPMKPDGGNSTAAAQVEREKHNALSAMGSCDQLLIKTKGVPKWLCTESAIETNTNGCNLSYYLHRVGLTQINTILTV